MPTVLASGGVKINDFNATVTSGPVPLHVYFTGDVTGNVTMWYWTFTNTNTGKVTYSHENVTAVHNFLKPGICDVKLYVSGPEGNDTMEKKGYINATA